MGRQHRVLSALLSVTLVTGFVPASAYAADDAGQPNLPSSETAVSEEGELSGQDVPEGLEKSFATQLEEASTESFEPNGSAAEDASDALVPQHGDDDMVTVIVQLADNPNPNGFWLFGGNDGYGRDTVKSQIANIINGRAADDNGVLPFFSLFSRGAADDTALEVIDDYSTVMQGFAISVPYRFVGQIKELAGVKNAFVEHEYSVPEDQGSTFMEGGSGTYRNKDSLEMVGADASGYTGKGQVVAVIDSGLDWDHEAFSAEALDAASVALTKETSDAAASKDGFHGQANYKNAKIPYAWDYSSGDAEVTPPTSTNEHGTHVAGIVAANGGSVIRGVAPDAQIVPLKVSQDYSGTIRDSWIIAAVEDAVNLDVDAINMSLGSDAGFPADSDETYNDIYNSVERAGIMLSVAAGNSTSSAAYNQSGRDLAYASDPDSSIVASPSTYDAALSIASVNALSTLPYLTMADGTKIVYQPSSVGSANLADLNRTLEYYDAKYGHDADYTIDANTKTENVAGKIALIQRGSDKPSEQFYFSDKVKIAADHGAAGAIVYNNVPGEKSLTVMSITENRIPAAFITYDNGQALLKAQTKSLTVDPAWTERQSDLTMSSFSSLGVSPDLELKPEVAAPGGNIYSSVLNNAYASLSGTSMASPHMAGLTVDVSQYVREMKSGISKADAYDLSEALLMSTAEPVKDGEDSYVTPRKQGAGLANLKRATTSKAYLSVEGADAATPKASIGASVAGTWNFTFSVHNLTSEQLSYSLDAAALSSDIENGFFAAHSTNYQGKGVDVSFSTGGAVTVPANGKVDVTVSITAGDSFKTAVQDAVNGTFLDGFVMLRSNDGGVDLSIPYVGFYGNWSAAPVFDEPQGSQVNAHMRAGYAYSTGTQATLGSNPLVQGSAADASKATVAPYSLGGRYASSNTAIGLLRNAGKLTYQWTPKENPAEVVKSYEYQNVVKSRFVRSANVITYAEAFLDPQPTFDGTGPDGRVLPAGWYTQTVSAYVMDGDDEADDTYTFDIYLDTDQPQVKKAEVYQESNYDWWTGQTTYTKKIRVTVLDAGFIAGVQLATTNGYAASSVNASPAESGVDQETNLHYATYVFDYDTAANVLAKDVTSNQNRLIVNAYDYGLTMAVAPLNLSDVYPSGVALDEQEVTLHKGASRQLNATLAGDNLTKTDLAWDSSNKNVATVDNNGLISAVGEGEADITVTAEAAEGDTAPTARAHIKVEAIPADVGIVLDKNTLTATEGGTFVLTATVADSLSGATVEWASESESVTKLASSVGGAATFDALKPGRTAVTATVSSGGATYRARCDVNIEAKNAADFVINDQGVLIDYVGSSVNVVIPSNVTAIGQRPDYGDGVRGVFQGLPIESVTIPDTVTSIADYTFDNAQRLQSVEIQGNALVDIGSHAFSQCYKLPSIKLPESVRTIGSYAFYYGGLSSINLPEGMTEIAEGVFSGDSNLSTVNIPSTVTSIGKGAFSGTSSVPSLTLPSGLVSIGDSAFSACGAAEFDLPSTVKEIGANAFANSKATRIDVKEGVETIGNQAFSSSNAEEVNIPDSAVSVGTQIIAYAQTKRLIIGKGSNELELPIVGAHNLASIEVDPENTNMVMGDDGALYNIDKTKLIGYALGRGEASFTVPDTVVDIASYAFFDDQTLTSVVIGANTATIGASAFYNNDSLGSVTLSDKVETLGGNAFASCASLTNMDLKHVKAIGGSCFAYDDKLATIDLGDSLENLGNMSLTYTALSELVIPDTCTTIGNNAFTNCPNLLKVHLGKSVVDLPDGSFTGDTALQELTVSAGNAHYDAVGAALYKKNDDGTLTLMLYLPTATAEDYIAPDNVRDIANFAFYRNPYVKRIVFKDGLTNIGTSAFNRAEALEELVLPDSVKTIGSFAFSSTKIDVLTLGPNLTSIDSAWTFGFLTTKHLVLEGSAAEGGLSIGYGTTISDLETVYLGPGYSKLDFNSFNENRDMKTFVVNTELKSVDKRAFDPSSTVVFYVNPAYADTYKMMQDLGIGTVKEYTPLAVRTTTSPVKASAGDNVKLVSTAEGGVGAREYRFVKLAPNGAEEEVLQDWSPSSTCDWTVPTEAAKVRTYVRDTTYHTVSGDTVVSESYTAGTYAANVTLRTANGDLMPLDAWVDHDGTVSIDENQAAVINFGLNELAGDHVKSIAVNAGAAHGVGASSPSALVDGTYRIEAEAFTGKIPVLVSTDLNDNPISAYLTVDMDTATAATNKAKLNAALKEVYALNPERYTADTWSVLSAALAKAEDLAADAQASQVDVEAAATALDEARAALVRNDSPGYNWPEAGAYDMKVGVTAPIYGRGSNCSGYEAYVDHTVQIVRASNGSMKLLVTFVKATVGPNSYGSAGGTFTAQDLTKPPTYRGANYNDIAGVLVSEDVEAGSRTYSFDISSVDQSLTFTLVYNGIVQYQYVTLVLNGNNISVPYTDDVADKTALIGIYMKAAALDLKRYVDGDAKTAFEDALASAKGVLKYKSVSQEDVDAAATSIEIAQRALMLAPDTDALKEAIGTSAVFGTPDFTATSVAGLKAAAQAADKVAANDPTSKEVESAITSIVDAVADLIAAADKTDLRKAVSTAEAVDVHGYRNGNSKTAFLKALSDAKALIENEDVAAADQSSLDAAAAALRKAAFDLLEDAKSASDYVNGDPSALNGDITAARALVQGDKADDAWTALQTSIDLAQAVSDNAANVGQDDIDDARAALAQAVAGFSAAADAASAQELDAAIESAATLESNDTEKTDAAHRALKDAIATARKVADAAFATTDEVKAASGALTATAEKFKASAADKTDIEAAVADAELIKQSGKTAAAWRTLGEAIAAARAALEDPFSTADTVSAARSALALAVATFKSSAEAADKNELGYYIEKAKAVSQGDKTERAFKALQDAIAAAEAVGEADDASQAVVDAAGKNLVGAVATFSTSATAASVADLVGKVSQAKSLEQGNKTDAAWTALQDAIYDANKAAETTSVAQTVIDDAATKLEEAVKAFGSSLDKVDKSALSAAIGTANALAQGNKTGAAWKALKDAVYKAQVVFYQGSATQQSVDQAVKDLNNAIEAFNASADKGDPSSLNEAIAQARAISQGNKTDEAWTALQGAIATAADVAANADSTQPDIDAAAAALAKAVAAFTASSTVVAGAVFEAPISWQREDGSMSHAGSSFEATAQVEKNVDGTYLVVITATTAADPLIEGVSYGTLSMPAKVVSAVGASPKSYQIVVPNLEDRAPVGFTVTIPGSGQHNQSAYLVLDAGTAVKKEAVDTSQLTSAIAAAKALEQGNKTEEAYRALQDAVRVAEAVAGGKYVTKSQVDAARTVLAEAVETFASSGIEQGVRYTVPISWQQQDGSASHAGRSFDGIAKLRKNADGMYDIDVTVANEQADAMIKGLTFGTESKQAEVVSAAGVSPKTYRVVSATVSERIPVGFTVAVPGSGQHNQSAYLVLNTSALEIAVDPVDITPLTNAIAAAKAIEQGAKSAEAYKALQDAIAVAEAAAANTAISAAEVEAAVANLNDAVSRFKASEDQLADKTALREAITLATSALNETAVSVDGSDVPMAKKWVPAQAAASLREAVSAAQAVADDTGATKTQIEESLTALRAAIETFNAAAKPGTMSAKWSRLFGDDALDTMTSIVNEGWSGETGGTVVVSTVDGYWDALTAAGLAGLAKAPVLMTDGSSLSSDTAALVRSLAPAKVIVCGGPAAISDGVLQEIRTIAGGNAQVERCFGENAAGTAVDIFQKANSMTGASFSDTAWIATDSGYWDALAAAPVAYAKGMPIFLTNGSEDISEATLTAMKNGGIAKVYIAGGPATVSEAVVAKIEAAGITVAGRFGGDTAVETSVAIADFGLSLGLSADGMAVATTDGFHDALSGAALCGKNGSPLVLVNDARVAPVVSFVEANKSSIARGYAFGGPVSISDDVLAALDTAAQ